MLFNGVNSDVGCLIYSNANNSGMVTRTSAETISKTPGDDAERIKAMMADSKLSQAEFAETYGIGSQAQLWQFLNPESKKGRPLNLPAAIGFATGLNCRVGDFSPSLQKFIDKIALYSSMDAGKHTTQLQAEEPKGVYQFQASTTKAVVEIMDRLDEKARQTILEHALFIEHQYQKQGNPAQRHGS